MKDSQQILEVEVARLVQPILACPGRKRAIREELLLHLTESYKERLSYLGDERAALDAAIQQFGQAGELQLQLQASVPVFERIFFTLLKNCRETPMSKLLSIVGIIAIVIGINQIIPRYSTFIVIGLLIATVTIGLAHMRLLEKHFQKMLGSRWPLLIGLLIVLLGSSVILPGLAKYKNTGLVLALLPSLLGTLLMLEGVTFAVRGMMMRRTHLA